MVLVRPLLLYSTCAIYNEPPIAASLLWRRYLRALANRDQAKQHLEELEESIRSHRIPRSMRSSASPAAAPVRTLLGGRESRYSAQSFIVVSMDFGSSMSTQQLYQNVAYAVRSVVEISLGRTTSMEMVSQQSWVGKELFGSILASTTAPSADRVQATGWAGNDGGW